MGIGEIIGAIGSAASGGLFGVIGAGISSFFKYKRLKQEQEFEARRWDHDMNMARLQMEAASQQGSWQGLVASHEADTGTGEHNYKWVNAIKSLYRPILTTGLIIVTYLFFQDVLNGLANAESTMAKIFEGAELKEIMRYIVYSIVFSTATAIAWWFAERALQPPGYKNR